MLLPVTGSSTGFGLALTEAALEHGDKVVATLRNPTILDDLASKYGPDQLCVVKLDVTKPEEIENVFATAKRVFGRVDIVFNNAGIGAVGEIEAIPEEIGRRIFDVNFWGAANVSKTAVRFFREENPPGVGGRLITNSSAGGFRPHALVSYYSSAKFGKHVSPL